LIDSPDEFDPLRDEGDAYARLAAAGVPVTCRCLAGMMRLFLSPDALPEMARRLRHAFATCS
jgi:acetyl esterase/lipase